LRGAFLEGLIINKLRPAIAEQQPTITEQRLTIAANGPSSPSKVFVEVRLWVCEVIILENQNL